MMSDAFMPNYYENKTILVTGGAGSIGSELVRSVLKYSPKTVRVLDNDETRLFELEHSIHDSHIRTFVGDVKDYERLKRAIEDVDLVFHAAALKHVPLCEYNPFEAVKTNVVGTQNVINASLDEEVEKMILISTDKAVNPTNVMGATKLLAERLTISANNYKGRRKTCFSCVRFGNVLNSRGSVLPVFIKEIQNGGPVTITDPCMTRFTMSIPRAISLILRACEMAQGGEIFILKMNCINVMDLAEAAIEFFAPRYGFDQKAIPLKTVGRRPGEKDFEELMSSEEAKIVSECGDLYIIDPNNSHKDSSMPFQSYTSNNSGKLSKTEIINEIRIIIDHYDS